MIYRCILPDWAKEENPSAKKVVEGEFSQAKLDELNEQFYNIYFLPNYPREYTPGVIVDGSHVDTFEFVFVDMDLKDGKYANKEEFIAYLHRFPELVPTYIVDSGNGVHAYWQVTDLDATSFLKFQRRLMRLFNTDEAVAKIFQLMRVPGTVNTKHKDNFNKCEYVFESDNIYTCEQLDRQLPQLTPEDEAYCKQHYEKTYKLQSDIKIKDDLPLAFCKLLRENKEVKKIWAGDVEDRSKGDYRLGHLMFANGFTKDEASSVLVNSAKALERSSQHRISYAQGIVDKIWTFEILQERESLTLSKSVKDILQADPDNLRGERFPCSDYLDATEYGFRLGQVIGLVAGSGVGKTAMALNMFKWFAERNPEYDHMFIPLEQPAREIADRWKTLCAGDTSLEEKVHVISNYDDDGTYRNLSFDDIKEYILKFQRVTGRKIGCVVIDHIGALRKKGKDGENQDLMDICHSMKAFAVQTNTMLVMQSQAPREKAGSGDLELSKDAAYGTVYFESYCDYLITIWQPLKRCYSNEKCPTVTAFKFCKIRHKKQGKDKIHEDVCYRLFFDPETERFRDLTEMEEKSFDYFNNQAVVARKKDRKTDLVPYKSVGWTRKDGKVNNS